MFKEIDGIPKRIHRALDAIIILQERLQTERETTADRVIPVQRAKVIFQAVVPVLCIRMLFGFQIQVVSKVVTGFISKVLRGRHALILEPCSACCCEENVPSHCESVEP